ncbi:MAG: adenosine deaminase [Nitrososphaeria archaeon]
MDELYDFIARLPKAELHLHLGGTLEPEMMLEKAKKNGIKLPYKSTEDARNAYRFKDLQSFLNLYDIGVSVLRDEQDFFDLAYAYFKKAASQNVRRAEVFFDPQIHTKNGIDFNTLIRGLKRASERAKEDLDLSVGLIMCFIRSMSQGSAEETLEQALQYRSWITGVCLAGKELGNRPSKFTKVFRRAKDEGFYIAVHAGEEASADYIWEAIKELKTDRIDHGYHMFEDPDLVDYIKNNRIPVTMCPLASVGVGYFKDILEVPVKRALDHGLLVSVHSDDPAYFGGYINENYYAVARSQKLSSEEIRALVRNSFESSFLDEKEKAELINKLNLS